MHFVDDVYLEASAARRVQGTFQQIAHIVDLRVGRGIQLYQINETSAVDFLAGTAFSAWRGGDTGCAIQRLGKNARDGGLADTSRAGEQIGVMQTILCESIAECANHVLLPRQLREGLGTPFACKDCCG